MASMLLVGIVMSAFAPKAHLGSAVVNWGPYYEKAVNDVLNNTWKTSDTKWGTKEGVNDLIKINDVVSDVAKKKVEEVKSGLKAGTFNVFVGPIKDNSGKVVLEKDQVGDDAWKGKINFFVEGVEGKVPSSK